MKSFYQEATPKTPKLQFNGSTGKFEVSGRSIPENSIEHYRPLLTWLENYLHEPAEHTHLIIRLEYFNTSSSKCLVEIFRKLERLSDKGHDTSVTWYYDEEDEDMEESGLDFKEIIRLPIEMVVMRN
ncbi:MAG: DUF1987 domain-containing protein [Cyclobacteriaceae bacterium]